MPWTVYIFERRNKMLYTGITKNMKKRLRTKWLYEPIRLVYSEDLKTEEEALRRAVELKIILPLSTTVDPDQGI